MNSTQRVNMIFYRAAVRAGTQKFVTAKEYLSSRQASGEEVRIIEIASKLDGSRSTRYRNAKKLIGRRDD